MRLGEMRAAGVEIAERIRLQHMHEVAPSEDDHVVEALSPNPTKEVQCEA